MSKILVIPNNIEEIKEVINNVDGFIIGINNLSINCNMYIDIKELDDIKDIVKDKELFISLNKNIKNSELDLVKDILLNLNNYNIKGVLYYDIGVLNIANSLNLNYDLVWSQEHSTTNYESVNFYNEMGAKYVYLSSEITIDEISTIKENTNSYVIVNMFGYIPMFASIRHIVKNYLDYFKLNDNSKINYMEKEGKTYPIIDNDIATIVYSSDILNGIKSYTSLNVDYVVLNSFNIELDKFIKVVEYFKCVNSANVLEYNDKINNMFTNTSDCFLNTKTVYRVKKNEK